MLSSQVMLKRIEQAQTGHKPETQPGLKLDEAGDVPGPWKECQAKKASFAQSVFSTESTDSLDFISENQPRLVSSMSCGNLAEVERTTSIVRSDSISLTEIPQVETTEEKPSKKAIGSFNRYTSSSIGNSLSLNSGLSSLQRHKLNLNKDRPVSEKRRSGLGRLVHPGSRTGSSRTRLDINQNGWKKNERKRESSGGGGKGGGGEAVVDMKLASKCCTLC